MKCERSLKIFLTLLECKNFRVGISKSFKSRMASFCGQASFELAVLSRIELVPTGWKLLSSIGAQWLWHLVIVIWTIILSLLKVFENLSTTEQMRWVILNRASNMIILQIVEYKLSFIASVSFDQRNRQHCELLWIVVNFTTSRQWMSDNFISFKLTASERNRGVKACFLMLKTIPRKSC